MRYLMRLFHNKKGFTLTELIIVIAIVSLLILSLVTFSAPVRLMVKGTDAKAECLTINNTIGDYLEHTLSYANDIRIFAGVDLAKAKTDIDAAYTAVVTGHNDSSDHPGMIVFHYVYDTEDKFKSGHRIYEFRKEHGDTQLSFTSSTVGGLTQNVIDDSKLLFYKEFYGPYSFFLKSDAGPKKNMSHQKWYLRLALRSYYFDGSYLAEGGGDMFMDFGAGESYYTNTDNLIEGYTDATGKAHTGLLQASTGNEVMYFGLENSLVNKRGDTSWYSSYVCGTANASGVDYGDDVVIIYNVKTYNYGSS